MADVTADVIVSGVTCPDRFIVFETQLTDSKFDDFKSLLPFARDLKLKETTIVDAVFWKKQFPVAKFVYVVHVTTYLSSAIDKNTFEALHPTEIVAMMPGRPENNKSEALVKSYMNVPVIRVWYHNEGGRFVWEKFD